MPFSIRRLFVLSLVFVLLIQLLLPIPGFASEKIEPQSSPLSDAKVTLEQAIRIVKENLKIPKEYTEFTSGYNNYNYRQAWYLNWNTSGESGGNFSSQVDALSGEILSIHSWKSSPNRQNYNLPKITLEQAQAIAEDTVEKLSGQKYSKLKLVEDDSVIPINSYGSADYSFRWQRIENGIPFQGNGANIQIDADNGEVLSYNLTWNTVNLPEIEGIIDTQQAGEAFSRNKMLELQYFLPTVYRTLAAGSKEPVQLVFQLNKNGLIDAMSGKPLVLGQDYWISADEYALEGIGAREALNSKSIPLTPEELREVEQNTTLLTKEEAIKVVKNWVEIPSDLTLRTMNLNTDSGRRDTKVWYFEWASSDRTKGQTITARIDAVNGELIGFNYYGSNSPLAQSVDQKTLLTKEEARKIAADFLKKIQPSKYQQVKIKADESSEAVSKPSPDVTSLSFSYERLVNGIVFSSNGMGVTVDLLTKKITSYNLNWWNLDFPQLSQAIPQSQAEASFLESRPFVLKYILVYNNGEPQAAKLVYQPLNEGNKVSDILDAKTGTFLDWQGKPLTEQPRSYRFADIAGNEAEKEITVLGLAGLFGEYGSTFKPKENVTAVSLLRSLLIIKNGTSDYNSLAAEDVLKKAKEEGWLKEELTPSHNISRELFSKIIIRYLGLEKIADLPIYQNPFQDADQLISQSQGYISLSTGLGILQVNAQKFEPGRTMMRAEAAYSIIQALGYGRI